MSKINRILAGWTNVINPQENIEALAAERMKACDQCPSKIAPLGIPTCKVCYCPLVAKTRSPKEVCPNLLWLQ